MSCTQTNQGRAAERDPDDLVALKLRLNEALRRRVADAANASVRSLNGEIIYRLKSSFEQEASEMSRREQGEAT
jgi:hypothetical protein